MVTDDADLPVQCLLHEDCATPQVCNAVTEAEFATRGYSDFDHEETQ